jgi:hypothetical protein
MFRLWLKTAVGHVNCHVICRIAFTLLVLASCRNFTHSLILRTLFLTLALLTWTIWRAPTNASKWRMGFNSAFKGLRTRNDEFISVPLRRLFNFKSIGLILIKFLIIVHFWTEQHHYEPPYSVKPQPFSD